jgi:ubiquinone/menaquinone biosynthesis C-methylase UbiE
MKNKVLNAYKKMANKGVFPHLFACTLLIPLRNIFLSPEKLIRRLNLEDGMRVLEVGAGPGYFSLKVAQAVPEGRLVISDIQTEMLAIAQKRLAKKHIENVSFHHCNGTDFPFEGETFDRIYMVTVFGEVENKAAYIKEFWRLLGPGGIVSVSEQPGDPDRLTIEEIKALFTEEGFEFDWLFGGKSNFTINFRK